MIEERTAEVAGTPVRWLEQGGDAAGLPVVLVHGIPTSPALWRHVLPQLTGLRVLALEMTGYGQSIPAGRTRDISVGAQADRLNAWLAHLGVDRAVLVGHDLGGGVVHIAAVRQPQRCAGLMITNGIGYDSWPIPSVKAMRAGAPLLAKMPAVALKPALGMLLARGHDTAARAKEALGVHYAPYAEHGGGAAMARQVSALDVRDTLAVQDALPTLRRPGPDRLGRRRPVPEDRVRRALRPRPRHHRPAHRGRQALHPRGPPRRHRRGDPLAARRGQRQSLTRSDSRRARDVAGSVHDGVGPGDHGQVDQPVLRAPEPRTVPPR